MSIPVHTFDSFRYRNYRLLWSATVLSGGGFWLQQVIVGWLTYQLTRSALLTSLALGLDALPVLLVGPLGGLLVDRWERRNLLVFTYTYQAVVTLVFSGIVLLEQIEAWHIFGFIFLMGLSWVITDPARMSLIPNIVPRANLVNAFALNSLAFSATRLAVPAIGGVVLARVGAGPALILQVLLQLGAVVSVSRLVVEPSSRPGLRLHLAFRELLEGARHIKEDPVILRLLLLGTLPSVLIMPFVQGLMPIYAAEVFGVGPTGLGLLLSSLGAGSTIGTFVLASLGDYRRKGLLMLTSLIAMGLAMVAFSLNPSYRLAFPNLLVLSAAMIMFASTGNAAVQSVVRDDFRGRVSGIYMATWGFTPFGSLLAGALADRLGAPAATLMAGGVLAAVLAGLALWFRPLWRYQ